MAGKSLEVRADGILVVEGNLLGNLEQNIFLHEVGTFSVGRKASLFRYAKPRAFDDIRKVAKKNGANIAVIDSSGNFDSDGGYSFFGDGAYNAQGTLYAFTPKTYDEE